MFRAAAAFCLIAYVTYGVFLTPAISQAAKWNIFPIHLVAIAAAALISLIGVFRRRRACALTLLAITPLIYLQFLSGIGKF